MRIVELEKIRIDGGTQAREKINTDAVTEYAAAMKAGCKFPPLTLYDDGSDLWLAKGFHRFHAYREALSAAAECEVIKGTVRDARLVAAGDNSDHGLRRTNADKRKAVLMLLADDEWKTKSNRWIAEQCHVDDKLVGKVRDESTAEIRSSNTQDGQVGQELVGKDGKKRKAKKKAGKKLKKKASNKDEPAAPTGDVLDVRAVLIPTHLRDIAADETLPGFVTALTGMVADIKRIGNELGGRYLLSAQIIDFLNQARNHIANGLFHCVCPRCHGKPKGCADCRQSGWMTKWKLEEHEAF